MNRFLQVALIIGFVSGLSGPVTSAGTRLVNDLPCFLNRPHAAVSDDLAGRSVLGVNLNKPFDRHLKNYGFRMLRRSETRWIRVTLDVFAYRDGRKNIDVQARALAKLHSKGFGTVVSIKHTFRNKKCKTCKSIRLYKPNSREERKYFTYLNFVLSKFAPHADIIVSGNEPHVDTLRVDWKNYGNGANNIPLVDFYKRVTKHVNKYLESHGMKDKPLYVGSFVRPQFKKIARNASFRRLLNFADKTAYVDGVDVHLHTRGSRRVEKGLSVIRRYTRKPLIATELTDTRMWKRNLSDKLGSDGGGFARKYNRSPHMTLHEYLISLRTHPVSKQEWTDFIDSRSWFEHHFIQKSYNILKKHGVAIGFVKMQQANSRPTSKAGMPRNVYSMFSPKTLKKKNGVIQTNHDYYSDFINISRQTKNRNNVNARACR